MTRRVLTVLICLFLLQILPATAKDKKATTRPETTEEAMKQKLSDVLVKGTLEQATEKIASLAGVKIDVDWQAVEATGVKRDKKVVMKAGGITPGELLDLILIQAATKGSPLAWYIDGKTVRVTTQLGVLQRNSLSHRAAAATTKADKSEKEKPKAEPLKIAFNETPLVEVIEYFRKTSDCNFYVNWKSLEQVGISKDTPVSLQVKDVSLGRALDLVLDGVSAGSDKYDQVYWIVNDGVIHVATGKSLDQQKTTRIYDVTDVLMVVQDFKAKRLNLEMKSGKKDSGDDSNSIFDDDDDDNGDRRSDDTAAEMRKKKEETLIKIIKDSIGDDMWQPEGKGSVKILQNKLYITQTLLGWKLLEKSLSK